MQTGFPPQGRRQGDAFAGKTSEARGCHRRRASKTARPHIGRDSQPSVGMIGSRRYEGRSAVPYKDDDIEILGWNMYMTPQQAAHGLALMQNYPEHVEDLGENGGYKDLTKNSVFKRYRVI